MSCMTACWIAWQNATVYRAALPHYFENVISWFHSETETFSFYETFIAAADAQLR